MLIRVFVALMLSSHQVLAEQPDQVDTNPLLYLLSQSPETFGPVVSQPEIYHLQIVYTQISRDENGQPSFETFLYRVNDEAYFYPASTVKLPVALFALEKLKRFRATSIDCQTTMVVSSYPATRRSILRDLGQAVLDLERSNGQIGKRGSRIK